MALAVWQIAAMVIGSDILLVSPFSVILKMKEMLFQPDFLKTILFSLGRIGMGFVLGAVFGAVLAFVACRCNAIEILFWPYITAIKAVPVASFVVIALVWIKSANLAVLISFLMVLPIIYSNLLEGIKSVDKQMLEMAFVFRMSLFKRLRYIWLPTLKPFVISAVSISLGLAWKSGIAAELIGAPKGSVGEQLYYSKLFLNTADLFAWTVYIVLLSFICEKLLVFLLEILFKGAER